MTDSIKISLENGNYISGGKTRTLTIIGTGNMRKRVKQLYKQLKIELETK